MHILFLSLDKSLLDGSGQGETLSRLQYWAKQVEKITVIIPFTKHTHSKTTDNISIIPAIGSNSFLAYISILLQLWQLHRRRIPVDVISVNDPIIGIPALLLRPILTCKVQVQVFGWPVSNAYWYASRWQNRILALAYTLTIRLYDSIRTDTQRDRQLLIKNYSIPKTKIITLPVTINPTDQVRLQHLQTNTVLKQTLAGAGGKVLLAVGRLVDMKGFSFLIEAFASVQTKIPEYTLVIVGDGPQKQELKRLAEKLKMTQHIRFAGAVPHDRLLDYYSIADIFVLPSLFEGFPRVLMMAGLVGLPVIATLTSGAQELIQDGKDGMLVEPANSNVLALAILNMLNDPKRCKLYGDRLQKKAIELLDFANIQNELIKSWKTLI